MKFYSFYVDKNNPSVVITPIKEATQTVVISSGEEEDALVCLMKSYDGDDIQIGMISTSNQEKFKKINPSSEDKRLFISKIWDSLEKQLKSWKGWV